MVLRGTFRFFLLSWSLAAFWIGTASAQIQDSDLPAGQGSIRDVTRNAFGYPLKGVTTQERRDFFVGNSFFKSAWVEAPSSTVGRDGLGPTFNANSCSSCHPLDGRGIGFRENGQVDFSLLIRMSFQTADKLFEHHPVYGEQFNPFGVSGVPGEGKVSVEFEEVPVSYPDGTTVLLRKPHFAFSDLAFGAFEHGTLISPRVGTQLIGLGLLENIREQDILASEDPLDQNGDGIRGKANWVMDIEAQRPALGRFGWKASQPSVRQQSAAAFLGDIGLTTSLFPFENCPSPQIQCQNAPSGGQPEIDEKQLSRVTTYTQLLAVPMRRESSNPEVLLGEKLFHQISCQKCHTPSFVTGGDSPFQILNNQKIFPYTDMLLHDMGSGLADNRPDILANGRQWRTQPLWGIGLIPVVNGHQNLLHDARARNVEEAILWHGGEAEAIKQNFMNLNRQERTALIRFINSL